MQHWPTQSWATVNSSSFMFLEKHVCLFLAGFMLCHGLLIGFEKHQRLKMSMNKAAITRGSACHSGEWRENPFTSLHAGTKATHADPVLFVHWLFNEGDTTSSPLIQFTEEMRREIWWIFPLRRWCFIGNALCMLKVGSRLLCAVSPHRPCVFCFVWRLCEEVEG